MIVKENIIDFAFNQVSNKNISLDLGSSKFDIKISEFLSEESFKEKFSLIVEARLNQVISSILFSKVLNDGQDYLILQML
jgi:predicted N-acetyltransferase YhbS